MTTIGDIVSFVVNTLIDGNLIVNNEEDRSSVYFKCLHALKVECPDLDLLLDDEDLYKEFAKKFRCKTDTETNEADTETNEADTETNEADTENNIDIHSIMSNQLSYISETPDIYCDIHRSVYKIYQRSSSVSRCDLIIEMENAIIKSVREVSLECANELDHITDSEKKDINTISLESLTGYEYLYEQIEAIADNVMDIVENSFDMIDFNSLDDITDYFLGNM